MRRFWIGGLLLLPNLLGAQITIERTHDEQMRALNAVFRFRNDIDPDSTLIARCTLIGKGMDSTFLLALDPRFRAALAGPTDSAGRATLSCRNTNFADPKHRVVWLDQAIQIQKTAAGMQLPEFRRVQYEFVIQLLQGGSYREWQKYVVEPAGISGGFNGDPLKFSGWRVVEYQLLGWDFHWGDNAGHGSSVRIAK